MEVKKTVNEIVSDAKQVRSFWQKLFGTNPEPATPQPVAKKKETYIAVDETQVMADIVSQLTKLFRLEEQLATHIREAEEKSRNVYDPDANLMEAALQRVLAQQQMAELIVTVRETMVYQSPPEAKRNLQAKSAYLIATTIFLLYLWSFLLLVNRWGKT